MTTPHLAVFGHLFDLPARAGLHLGPEVHVTAFVQRSRLATTDGIEGADAVVALPDAAPASHWTAQVRAVHESLPLTHGAALTDHLLAQAAGALREVGVPFHSPQTVGRVLDKRSMRDALARAGGPVVPHRQVTGLDAAERAVAEIGFPCVLKPSSGTGSNGAVVVREQAEIREAFAQASAVLPEVLVERFVTGPQYSVEAFSEDGEHVVLAVTRKFSDPVSLVELGHVLPADLPAAERRAVAECTTGVLDAVGLRYGPSHTEVILGPEGPMPIETHARVGGDDIWLMVHDATGVDLDDVQARQVCGEQVLPSVRRTLEQPRPVRHEAVWFGGPAAESDFSGLTVPSEVRDAKDVEVTGLAESGASARPLVSSDDRVFQVRAHGESAQDALARATEAAAAVAAASGPGVTCTAPDDTF